MQNIVKLSDNADTVVKFLSEIRVEGKVLHTESINGFSIIIFLSSGKGTVHTVLLNRFFEKEGEFDSLLDARKRVYQLTPKLT